jgi:hypothetical protein
MCLTGNGWIDLDEGVYTFRCIRLHGILEKRWPVKKTGPSLWFSVCGLAPALGASKTYNSNIGESVDFCVELSRPSLYISKSLVSHLHFAKLACC